MVSCQIVTAATKVMAGTQRWHLVEISTHTSRYSWLFPCWHPLVALEGDLEEKQEQKRARDLNEIGDFSRWVSQI